MRKIFTLMTLMVLVTINASAKDFDAYLKAYQTNNWLAGNVLFDITEIATAAGYADTTAFMDFVRAQEAAGKGLVGNVYTDPDSVDYNYSADGCGFWMNSTGLNVRYSGEGAIWYACGDIIYDANKVPTHVEIYMGQMPSKCVVGDKYTTRFVIESATPVYFNVTEEIVAPDVYPYAQFEIVGTAEFTASQDVTGDEYYESYSLAVSDIASKIGMDVEDVKAQFAKLLFGKQISESGAWTDSLTNYLNGEDGFYFSQLYDEDNDKDLPECAISDNNNVIYINNFVYDGANVTFTLGQVEKATLANSQYWAYVYVVNGTKAYQIKITLNTGKLTATTIDDMTKVGGEEINEVFHVKNLASMEKRAISIDLNQIVKCFGDVTVDDLEFADLASTETRIPNYDYTCSNGFYMDWDGTHCSWGQEIMHVKIGYTASKNILQFAYTDEDSVAAGNTFYGSVYLIHRSTNRYYEFKFNVELTNETIIPIEECEEVAIIPIEVQLLVTDDEYTQDPNKYLNIVTHLDKEFIVEKIGTTSPALYGKAYSAETPETPYWSNDVETWSGTTTTGNTNGFWINAESNGKYIGREGTYKIGFSYGRFMIEWWHHASNPGAIGETTEAHFYLANLKEGKMVQIAATITFIDPSEYKTITEVGKESINVAANDDGCATLVDLDKAYELLGCTAEEFAASGQLKAPISASSYIGKESVYYDETYEGFSMNSQGLVVDAGDPEEAEKIVLYLGLLLEDKAFFVTSLENLDDDQTYSTKMALDYNSNRYIYNITITNPTAISEVKVADKKSAKAYNLAGQAVDGSFKGIVIRNGQKKLMK